MLKGLTAWLRERFYPPLTLVLAAVLNTSGRSNPAQDLPALALQILRAWLILFALRAADDVSDLEKDRRHHPGRVLAGGRIKPGHLLAWAAAAALLAAGLSRDLGSLARLGTLAVCYGLFFRFKNRLGAVLQPFWINAVFGFLVMEPDPSGPATLALGAFAWLAACGHDFCHSIADPDPSLAGTTAARMGITCYLLALAAAMVSLGLEPNLSMALVLAACTIWLAFHLVQLARQPEGRFARALYVRGFAAFILPLAARIVGALVKGAT